MKFLKYSTNEVFSSKKFFEKLQKGAALGSWRLADFWQFLIFSTFYKNWVNWPSSGSENLMHNIILKIFGKKYFRKIVKWWCSKPKTIKNLNFSRSAILKIFKNIFFLKNATICICKSYLQPKLKYKMFDFFRINLICMAVGPKCGSAFLHFPNDSSYN